MKKRPTYEELEEKVSLLEKGLMKGVQAENTLPPVGKELNCLHAICNLIDTPGIFMEEILQETVGLLPIALKHPSLAHVRITLHDQTYETLKYEESKWRLISDIKVRGKLSGIIEVCYRQEPPSNGHVPFLPEEVKMLDVVANYLGLVIGRQETEEEIKHLATHDALTDLPTLNLARDRLGMVINLARRNKTAVAVMFVDLDGFKIINDNLGHEAGDYLLIRTAQRLLACVRESDTVARVGGDEFLIIASGIHAPENAEQIAERVTSLLSQPIIFKRKQSVVGSASIGIACYPYDGEEMENLIKQAEEAMYNMKKNGKKEFFFQKLQ